MSRQDTIVSAPFTSRSANKSPTESIAVFLFGAPQLPGATADVSDSVAEPSSCPSWTCESMAKQLLLPSLLQSHRLPIDSSSYILPPIPRSNRPKNLHHCYRIRQIVIGLASPKYHSFELHARTKSPAPRSTSVLLLRRYMSNSTLGFPAVDYCSGFDCQISSL